MHKTHILHLLLCIIIWGVLEMAGAQGRYETEKAGGSNGGEPKPRRHNFLMPNDLNWGRQKSLPFPSKLIPLPLNSRKSVPAYPDNDRDGRRSKSPVANTTRTPSRRSKSSISSQVESVREKLSDGLKLPVSEEKKKKKEKKQEVEDDSLPWNLRTRRSSNNVGGGSGFSPLKGLAALAAREKGEASGGRMPPPPPPPSMPKFSLTLSKQEIEEDLWAMTGGKPPKKLKKRSRAAQKNVNALAPGKYLPDVAPDSYAVSDTDKF